ncbi:MAG: hypothetical protein IT480_17225 [Gammaproteobacteria bacterium]|nr:hypothetical protein [Gammaproteobacteria bacterium]
MALETRLTSESLRQLEQQFAEAIAATQRAESMHADLAPAYDHGDTIVTAACFAAWRARERQRELELRLRRARA